MNDNSRLGVNYDELETTEEISADQLMSEATKRWISERKSTKKSVPKWIMNADLEVTTPLSFPSPDYSKYKELTMVEIFEQFIDVEFIEHLVKETRRYALFLNCPDPNITTDEIKCFIAILFVSGYNDLPSKRHYWSSGEDLKNLAVSDSMRRGRFMQICRFLHFTNNTKPSQQDKAWKLRPIMKMLKDRCIRNFQPEENLAYDESMIKYFGKHGCKQFIRAKPIRFGFKVWCINTKAGYLVNFDPYQGKSPKSNDDYQKLFGKASSPLLVMLDELPDEKRNLRYHFYMDNLFSGPALFSFIRFRGYHCVGTIRDNRIPKPCPLLTRTEFKKKKKEGTMNMRLKKMTGFCIYVGWIIQMSLCYQHRLVFMKLPKSNDTPNKRKDMCESACVQKNGIGPFSLGCLT